jgi:hypothetical protein
MLKLPNSNSQAKSKSIGSAEIKKWYPLMQLRLRDTEHCRSCVVMIVDFTETDLVVLLRPQWLETLSSTRVLAIRRGKLHHSLG